MYAFQKDQLRKLNRREFKALLALCRLSKNLFNLALYEDRQYFFLERKKLAYESIYHLCKLNENYRLLNTDIAQQTIKVVDRSMRSFLEKLRKSKTGTYAERVQLPKYLGKDGYFSLIIPRIRVKKNGIFAVPMSQKLRKKYGQVRIRLPKRLKGKTIKEVRIHPKHNGRWFEIEYVFKDEKVKTSVDKGEALAIDIGVTNLAGCIDTLGHQFLIDGKRLKSINGWYNRRNAELQSKKSKGDSQKFTYKQARLFLWRSNCVRDYLSKVAKLIINHCLEHKIGNLVVGYNPGIKFWGNTDKFCSQSFIHIPFWRLRKKLEALCIRYGIEYHEVDESYTSESSFYDSDQLPIYNADNPQFYEFSGKRIKRGLYKTKDEYLVSSDINASANILRRFSDTCKHGLNFQRVRSGFLANPLRILVS